MLNNFVVDESIDYSEIKTQMSKYCSFLRGREKCEELLVRIRKLLENYPLRHKSLSQYFYDKDMLISAKALLETVTQEMQKTGSRGGAVFYDNGKAVPEDLSYRKYVTVTRNGKIFFEEVSPIPEVNEAFEKSLYPKDFICSLPESNEYFGAKVIFGSCTDDSFPGLNIVRTVPEEETKET